MNKVKYFIGIDISSDFFTVSYYSVKEKEYFSMDNFENTIEGYQELIKEFNKKAPKINKKNSVICMEATGVYGEELSYYLSNKEFFVSIENPLKVKRAFGISQHKTDKIDSKKIAEYAFRFFDALSKWSPNSKILEEFKVLLVQREQIIKKYRKENESFT